jgi:hypothetical protein
LKIHNKHPTINMSGEKAKSSVTDALNGVNEKLAVLLENQKNMMESHSQIMAALDKLSSAVDEDKETRNNVYKGIMDTQDKTLKTIKESGARKTGGGKGGKSAQTGGARRFPTNSITWFKEQYVADEKFRHAYFDEKALAKMEAELSEEDKKKVGEGRALAEAIFLYKNMVSTVLKKRIGDDWKAAEEEFINSNRTPASEDKSEKPDKSDKADSESEEEDTKPAPKKRSARSGKK